MAERSPAPSTPGIAGAIAIRAATSADREAIWSILEPTIRLGETYTLPRNLSCDDALAFWCAPGFRAMQFNSSLARTNGR